MVGSTKRDAIRGIPIWACLVAFLSGGCEDSQARKHASDATEQIQTLVKRVEELENGRELDSDRDEAVPLLQIDHSTAGDVFADVTRVVPGDRNIRIDFGASNNASGGRTAAQLSAYMNYYTAKRFHAALSASLDRHTSVFGVLEGSDPVTNRLAPDEGEETCYANFVRLTGTGEELILDLGLNRTPVGIPGDPVPIAYTVTMDFHTASTLFRQLDTRIADYEAENGPIETDVQKRVAD